MGRWDNIMRATHIFPHDLRESIHIKSFDATYKANDIDDDGYIDNAVNHGHFTQMRFWDRNVWDPKSESSTKGSQGLNHAFDVYKTE
jgi:hypothetical protein